VTALFFIPFAVFGFCVLAHMWLLSRVRDYLFDAHPDTYRRIERSSLFVHWGLMRFTTGLFGFGTEYRSLGDAELNRQVRKQKVWLLAAICAWCCNIVAITLLPTA
jgi:hypothetical protein